ncbi:penicillin-binding transpeptidase domain-containing protein [Rhodococcus sp. IEGM 1408]|uniref:penicillin-binding transpeptidase domain-containing protein n=1 Tax=Rhodococcus sp. IEGM 1408 TaxID=3082220 RepID=UPI0029550E77|nr:penicillin-binding transpeptidase domain-containing protein [Rhodococcus sp. IEGM 1408]MDV7999784.1 penicillin-binding transpeptidase domain-containing protein [Rhodococcus sp. IEGM 1408]
MTPSPHRRRYPDSARRRFLPTAGLLAAAVTVALAGNGCAALTGDTGADELQQFVDEMARGDIAGAAALTTDPAAAEEQINANRTTLAGSISTASTTGSDRRPDKDPVPLEIRWTLPPATQSPAEESPPRTVITTGEVRTTKIGEDWKVAWAPTVLDTRLQPSGQLKFVENLDWDTDILDRTGASLFQWTPVTGVALAPEAVGSADAVAALVSGAEPAITGQSIRDGMAELGDQTYTVVSLRPADIAPIREQLAAIPGVTLPESGRLVQTDRSLRSPALTELEGVWIDALREKGGWSATIDNPGAEPIRLGGAPMEEVDDLVSTLQPSIQAEAQRAVDASGLAASIVAIQPSTGGVLAVAQNSAADQQGPVSLQGLFPPGSTFKTVTTAAALDARVVGPEEIVPCPASITVSGRTIPNDSDFALGPVPLETAFARSCNTSQAVISDRLAPEAMRDTAASLGLGVDFTTPGLTTITGQVPVTEQGPARVEAAIGQGEVLASPFGMAVLEASLANGGRMILPSVIAGMPAVADQYPEPLPPSVVDTVRRYMEQTVRSGTATAASSIPGLGGKTGTAEVGSGPAHGWFVGSTGDIALAVLIEGADSSGPAVTMAADFLRGAGQPVPLPAR